jgi:hypothetical protein
MNAKSNVIIEKYIELRAQGCKFIKFVTMHNWRKCNGKFFADGQEFVLTLNMEWKSFYKALKEYQKYRRKEFVAID